MTSSKNREPDITILSRTLLVVFLDVLFTVLCYFCGLWLRFDFKIGYIQRDFMGGFASNMGIWCLVTVAVFTIFRLYSNLWLYVSATEIFRIIGAYAVLGIIGVLGIKFYGVALPRSSCIIGFVFSFLCTVGIRFSYRLLKTLQVSVSKLLHATGVPNVMIIGAGDAGSSIAEEYIQSECLGEHLSCFIDDNPGLKHKRLCGVPVAGSRKFIPDAVNKYRIDKIIFAIPSASPATRKKILEICCTTGCQVLVLPDQRQMDSGKAAVRMLRKATPQDLLGREPVEVCHETIKEAISGKTVLVAGGAGTVGRELCRQIAKLSPRTLVMFDLNEKAAYDVQMELEQENPNLNLQIFIGSLQNENALQRCFSQFRPELVFHSAGYKFVTYMEQNPEEAVVNNVLGTLHLAEAAKKYGTERFLMISTERAEHPCTMAGATKRVAEMVLSMENAGSGTRFSSVRFGNILDHEGGVAALFRRQIEQGGPVTVTHPDATRYFMGISDAVSLILQTMAGVEGGEIFSLDMGEPVKIDHIARSLIRLSGHEPDADIKVQYIGLRPGEKLHETPVMRKAGAMKTENSRIYRIAEDPVDGRILEKRLEAIAVSCAEGSGDIRHLIAELTCREPALKTREET